MMSRLMRRPRLMLVAVFLLGALLAGSGVVVAATVVKSGKAVTAVKAVTSNDAWQFSTATNAANTWTDVTGMSLNISVPSSQKALLLITFASQVYCHDGDGTSVYCKVRVLVDGNEASPGDVIFDGGWDGNGAIETNSMQWVHGPVNAGQHTIKVQALLDEASSNIVLSERTLTVLRSRV
jgi:hypothetical protein